MNKKDELKTFMKSKKQAENSNDNNIEEKLYSNQNKIETFINNFIDQYYKGKLNSKL